MNLLLLIYLFVCGCASTCDSSTPLFIVLNWDNECLTSYLRLSNLWYSFNKLLLAALSLWSKMVIHFVQSTLPIWRTRSDSLSTSFTYSVTMSLSAFLQHGEWDWCHFTAACVFEAVLMPHCNQINFLFLKSILLLFFLRVESFVDHLRYVLQEPFFWKFEMWPPCFDNSAQNANFD